MNNKKYVTVPVLIKRTIYVTHFYFTSEGNKRQRVARLNAPFEPQYDDMCVSVSFWDFYMISVTFFFNLKKWYKLHGTCLMTTLEKCG